MMKIYVVINGANTKVYTDRTKAEAERDDVNYCAECAGGYGKAYIVETELNE